MNKKTIGKLSILLTLSSFLICSCAVIATHNDLVKKEEIIHETNNRNDTIKGIEIDSSSLKKVYEINESFDEDNLLVYKIALNDEKTLLSKQDYVVKGFDSSKASFNIVNIIYDNYVSSIDLIIKGYEYHNYDEKYVYYINETFNKEYFELYKYDETGKHEITDYVANFPDNTTVGLGKIVITYEDFRYESNIAIMPKQINVPGVFLTDSNATLLLFVNDVHNDTYNGNSCTLGNGYYLLIEEDGSLTIYDYHFMLMHYLNASYFGSNNTSIVQRLIPGGDLIVEIEGMIFRMFATDWHHTFIGW